MTDLPLKRVMAVLNITVSEEMKTLILKRSFFKILKIMLKSKQPVSIR